MNVITGLGLLLQLTTQLQGLAGLIRTAQSQGRDITEAELDTLIGQDTVARALLAAAIAAAKGK